MKINQHKRFTPPLPSVVEKNIPFIRNISSLTIYESGWEDKLPGKSFGPHKWNFNVLHFVIEGEGFLTIKDRKYPVKSNQVFLIPAGQETTHTADINNPWKYFWIGFDGNQSNAILEMCGFSDYKYVIPFNDMMLIRQTVSRINKVKNNQVAYEYFILGCLYEVFAIMFFNSKKRVKEDDKKIYIDNAKAYMKENLAKHITVSDIAKHVGFDRSYFTRTFKNYTGKAPKTYLQELRLSFSLVLLTQTDLSLKQISLDCGFNDYSHFYNSFYKVNKITPTAYRNSLKKSKDDG